MKVEVQNKKGLTTTLSVIIDKKIIQEKLAKKLSDLQSEVSLKGFRPGKVPKEILKKQFGKAVFSEVLDKVLKDTSAKALEDNKIKPAGQPKLDLKTYGEDKDLEYVLSITELPKVDTKAISDIKFDLIINTRSLMEMDKDIIKYYFDFIHNHVSNDGFFLNINRYRKKSVGYPIHFYEYPYDSSWNVVSSKRSWRQYWVHSLFTQRSLDIKKNDIKSISSENSLSVPLKEARENFEKEYLTTQLKKFNGNISKTADFIGMERTALHRKLKSLGVKEIN